MTSKPRTAAAVVLALLAAGPALAQSSASVAAHTDWSVFVESDPRECYIASQPESSTARRDGQPVEVQRGDIRLFVSFRPGDNVTNEVSFTGGYPFRDGQHGDAYGRLQRVHADPRPGRRQRMGLDRCPPTTRGWWRRCAAAQTPS